MRDIIYWPHPALRTVCQSTEFTREILEQDFEANLLDDIYDKNKVDWSLFKDNELSQLIDDMTRIMRSHNGIGLAANQSGETNHRLIVMEGNVDENGSLDEKNDNSLIILINPSIVGSSEEKRDFTEGCLSFPEQHINIKRPKYITISYVSIYGKRKVSHLSGLLAVCAQHELDHLNGKAIIDYANPFARETISKKMKLIERKK